MLSYEGYEVLVASDGGTGLEIALAARPDLVVTDVNLPVLSGWEIARALKADPCSRAIPLIAVSAGDAWENRETAASLGFERYLEKPCTPSRLLDEVAEVLGVEGIRRADPPSIQTVRPYVRTSSSGVTRRTI